MPGNILSEELLPPPMAIMIMTMQRNMKPAMRPGMRMHLRICGLLLEPATCVRFFLICRMFTPIHLRCRNEPPVAFVFECILLQLERISPLMGSQKRAAGF